MHSHLSLLLLVNVMTCGLEVCLAVGTIYIPPLLLEAGLEERYMTMVLGVGPVLGLIFVPLIGSASDTWRGRFGRRRPFIWALSLGVLLALVLIPHATSLAALLALRRPRWLEVSLLVLGIILLQFCGQACFTPLEALVSDLFSSEQDSRWAFTVFSLMISLGGCLGYLLPAVDWHIGGAANYLGSQEAFIYALLTLIFLGCMLSTLLISEESAVSVEAAAGRVGASRICRKPWHCCGLPIRLYSTTSGLLSVLPHSLQMYHGMPTVLRRLFLADLFSWMALESFMLFYTDFVGERLYNGLPSAKPGSRRRQLYEEGVRMASLGLFLQCVTSVCCSLVISRLLARVGPKVLLLSSVALLALSTAVMTLSNSTLLVTIMTAATGITLCTLHVLPYTLICLYHSNTQVFFPSTFRKPANACTGTFSTQVIKRRSEELPGLVSTELMKPSPPFCVLSVPHPETDHLALPSAPRGMCLDLALLDSAYLLSQVVPSLLMGTLVQLTHNVSAYMASSCVLSMLAVALSSRIVFDWKDMELLQGFSC